MNRGVIALAGMLTVYGVAELLEGYGFIVAFTILLSKVMQRFTAGIAVAQITEDQKPPAIDPARSDQ